MQMCTSTVHSKCTSTVIIQGCLGVSTSKAPVFKGKIINSKDRKLLVLYYVLSNIV